MQKCESAALEHFTHPSATSLRRYIRVIGDLGTVPDCDDPHSLALDAVEEAIRGDDNFPIGEIGKIGQLTS